MDVPHCTAEHPSHPNKNTVPLESPPAECSLIPLLYRYQSSAQSHSAETELRKDKPFAQVESFIQRSLLSHIPPLTDTCLLVIPSFRDESTIAGRKFTWVALNIILQQIHNK